MVTLPCIVCAKTLESAMPDLEHNQPFGGTTFISYGQYGSTVFDAVSSSSKFLEINICDQCLVVASQKDIVLLVTPYRRTEYTEETWTSEVPLSGD